MVSGEVHLFKDRNTPQFIQDVKGGKLKDVSIGFIYAEDWTPGEFNKEKYDFIQRDIVINHVAVGVPKGRCPSPLCGLSVDMAEIKIGLDPWEETETSIRSGHGDKTKADTCRTKVINEGLSLVVCKDKDTGTWFDQSFIFKKDQGWTMQKAKEWFSKHNADSLKLVTQLAVETILADAMTPEEIDAKIKQLEKDRDDLRQQVDDLYTAERKKDAKVQEKIDAVNRKRNEEIQTIYAASQSTSDREKVDQLYRKIDGLNAEIQAFREAKVQGLVAGDETVDVDFGEADFPDSCFAYVPEEARGEKGKKSLRKLPYKNKDGSVNLPHVRNALARLDQTDGIPPTEKARIRKMLQALLKKEDPNYQASNEVASPSAVDLIAKTEDLVRAHHSHLK